MIRPRSGPVPALRLAALLSLMVLCTAGSPALRRSVGGTIPPDRPRAALVPLENLAGREEQGSPFTKVFFAHLVASGALEMAEPTRVDDAMDSLGIRPGGSLTPAEIKALGDSLHVSYLILGSVRESGKYQSGGADIPAVGRVQMSSPCFLSVSFIFLMPASKSVSSKAALTMKSPFRSLMFSRILCSSYSVSTLSIPLSISI